MSYLAAETLIVEHLQQNMQTVPAKKVLTAASLDGVMEETQVTPAVQIIFLDDQPEEIEKGEFNSQFTNQLWHLIVVVRNVKDKSGRAARDEAGEIVAEVISLLNGKHFKHPFGRMRRVKSPNRPTYREGFFYFPLLFVLRMKSTGSQAYRKPL